MWGLRQPGRGVDRHHNTMTDSDLMSHTHLIGRVGRVGRLGAPRSGCRGRRRGPGTRRGGSDEFIRSQVVVQRFVLAAATFTAPHPLLSTSLSVTRNLKNASCVTVF